MTVDSSVSSTPDDRSGSDDQAESGASPGAGARQGADAQQGADSRRVVDPQPTTQAIPIPFAKPPTSIFSPALLWVTIGACALVFLSAFESLAVTTIMPVVSVELDGANLYALAFAGPLAVGVIGMVTAGNWSDRSGPVKPLILSIALFIVGLLLAGLAESMWVLVAGRLVQGLGGGAMTVALYVMVARLYPPDLHRKIFAGFAAAWVVPSLIGPFVAGVVAQVFSWHWVFLGVVGLVAIATVMVFPALRLLWGSQDPDAVRPPWELSRLVWAVAVAVGVLVINVAADLEGPAFWILPIIGGVVALVTVRPLLPVGTFRARRGLPTVVLARGLASAAFFGTEVYLPYLLTREHGLTPAFAGLALTGGAVAWAIGSWLQGRLGDRLTNATALQIGTILVLVAVITSFTAALADLPPAVLMIGWVVSGGGMGLMFPRMSVMTLAYSEPDTQGFNSSAMSIGDAVGGALALAATGVVFAALDTAPDPLGIGGGLPFAGCFTVAAIAGIAAVIVARRVTVRPEPVVRTVAESPSSRV
jgi:MFS family permease